ncbi:MAG: peptidase E [Clostridia bacterium]|nr:peptidase E [Clostridia bacterium]MBQ9557299.1 peptidase E [Clostridia bacterium]
MKIVALGGGAVDENSAVDKFIVEFSGKERPRFLFLPTASGDGGHYINAVKRCYKRLGCATDALCLVRAKYSGDELDARVSAADIIYVGGGDPLRMMTVWERVGILPLLKAAAERGAVMCGISAGAMCWFASGYSDRDYYDASVSAPAYRLIDGLGFIPAVCCPHYDEEGRDSFDVACGSFGLPGIALENDAALVFDGSAYRLLKNDERKRGWLFSRENGSVIKTEISGGFDF